MKRNIVFLLLLLSTWMSWAQSNSSKSFYVYRSDGIVDTFLIAKVDSISFAEPTSIPAVSDSALAVDLGLSVRWANHNVGTSSPEGYGGLYGWADPTGTKRTINNEEYPSPNPSSNIWGTSYDIARTKWGGNWRLPTFNEQVELTNNCKWTWIVYNGVNGYKVVGPNGNSIFLPAASYRKGRDVVGQGSGNYWSGTLCSSTSSLANILQYGRYSIGLNQLERYYGLSVRPVKE